MSYFIVSYLYISCDGPRSGKTELMCLLSFNCKYVVSIGEVSFFLLMFGMGCIIFIVTLPWPSI